MLFRNAVGNSLSVTCDLYNVCTSNRLILMEDINGTHLRSNKNKMRESKYKQICRFLAKSRKGNVGVATCSTLIQQQQTNNLI